MQHHVTDIAAIVIAVCAVFHVAHSWSWRYEIAKGFDRLQIDFEEVRTAVVAHVYEPIDEDAPDMIAMLGTVYAPKSRPLTTGELENLLGPSRVEDEIAEQLSGLGRPGGPFVCSDDPYLPARGV